MIKGGHISVMLSGKKPLIILAVQNPTPASFFFEILGGYSAPYRTTQSDTQGLWDFMRAGM